MTVVQIPAHARIVSDADEEVFLLYTRLASLSSADGSEPFRGLGFLDSHQDTLTVRFELSGPVVSSDVNTSKGRSKRSGKAKKTAKTAPPEVVEIELAQDKTALHSRKGDTGSVLWQASVDFARLVLQQHRARDPHSLLAFEALSASSILELGAGTGLLGVALGPLARRYTVTDILAIVPLIRKNLQLNHERIDAHNIPGGGKPDVSAEPFDWLIVHSAPRSSWSKLRILSPSIPSGDSQGGPDVDLVLVVDCIYHPTLIPPLLSAVDYLASYSASVSEPKRESPDVLVVAELRSEEVIREFLEGWVTMEGWTIWSLNTGDGDGNTEGLGARYGVWLGRKQVPPDP